MTPLEKCYEKIAKKHNLSKYQVEDIFRAQFDFVAETMEKPERESVRLPFIGAIYTPKGAKKYYKEYYKVKNTDMYISNGLGTTIMNLRLFNKPSISLYRLTN